MNIPSWLKTYSPVAARTIEQVEEAVGTLPDSLERLYQLTNGLRTSDGASIYEIEDLEERQLTFGAAEHAPGHVIIGDDGGGRLFLLCRQTGHVLLADACDLTPERAVFLSPDLDQWVQGGLAVASDEDVDPPERADVYLDIRPPGGPRALLDIKRGLGIDTSIAVLRDAANSSPVRILRDVPYGKYRVRCRELNDIVDCLSLREVDNPTVSYPLR